MTGTDALMRHLADLQELNRQLREELNETLRDLADANASLEELRHIQRLLPATQETRP